LIRRAKTLGKEVVQYECGLLKIDVDEMACWWKNSEAASGSL